MPEAQSPHVRRCGLLTELQSRASVWSKLTLTNATLQGSRQRRGILGMRLSESISGSHVDTGERFLQLYPAHAEPPQEAPGG